LRQPRSLAPLANRATQPRGEWSTHHRTVAASTLIVYRLSSTRSRSFGRLGRPVEAGRLLTLDPCAGLLRNPRSMIGAGNRHVDRRTYASRHRRRTPMGA
jgi:hypothetical protein